MYPDPSILMSRLLLRCFGTMDTTVVPGTAKKLAVILILDMIHQEHLS